VREALNGLTFVLAIPSVLLSFVALELVLWMLAPGPLSATGRTIERGRGRCLLIGLLVATAGVTSISALGERGGIAGLAGALILGLLALGALTGMTAAAALLGKGALAMAEQKASRAVTVGLGAMMLALAGLFPLIGWVLFLYFVLVGLGGAVLALLGSMGRQKWES
jgi:hypothetical protein